ncbi:MAG: hypothetical protein ACLFTA_02645 [Candidatus Nanohaloarchaea archaeon]
MKNTVKGITGLTAARGEQRKGVLDYVSEEDLHQFDSVEGFEALEKSALAT